MIRSFRNAFLSAAALAATLALPAAPAHAQQADEKAVVEVLEKLFQGMERRDTALMRSLFTADAKLLGRSPRDGSITVTPVGDFIASIARAPAELAIVERIYQPEVRIDGDLAAFWAFYTLHLSERFSHCGVDAAHLFRTPDGWKIASLADTRRTERCDIPGGSR